MTDCKLLAQVDISRQRITIWEKGRQVRLPDERISSGRVGREFEFHGHPNGRVYDRFQSGTYISQGYRGMGNMPYAVFLDSGFAICGTPSSNWKKLGRAASTGSIRLRPDSAKIFNRLVRKYGVHDTWVNID
jgi:lipoprotein-anchoring transpeptidase ErfK/SrfK